MNATTMPDKSWEYEAKVLRRLLRLKEHKHFKGAAVEENEENNDCQDLKPVDGSCIRGIVYAARIMVIVGLCFIAGCFLAKHANASNKIVIKPYTASWYGTTGDHTDPWKHTTTANGEHFNENAMTAASWKYPLGSKVKVTNLRNGKSVIVRINDRGPGKKLYKKGRVIDLTRGSFARLADLRDGVIPVKVALCN